MTVSIFDLTPTRVQFASFTNDPSLIQAFENLFARALLINPTAISDLQLEIDSLENNDVSIESIAVAALNLIMSRLDEIELAALTPINHTKPSSAEYVPQTGNQSVGNQFIVNAAQNKPCDIFTPVSSTAVINSTYQHLAGITSSPDRYQQFLQQEVKREDYKPVATASNGFQEYAPVLNSSNLVVDYSPLMSAYKATLEYSQPVAPPKPSVDYTNQVNPLKPICDYVPVLSSSRPPSEFFPVATLDKTTSEYYSNPSAIKAVSEYCLAPGTSKPAVEYLPVVNSGKPAVEYSPTPSTAKASAEYCPVPQADKAAQDYNPVANGSKPAQDYTPVAQPNKIVPEYFPLLNSGKAVSEFSSIPTQVAPSVEYVPIFQAAKVALEFVSGVSAVKPTVEFSPVPNLAKLVQEYTCVSQAANPVQTYDPPFSRAEYDKGCNTFTPISQTDPRDEIYRSLANIVTSPPEAYKPTESLIVQVDKYNQVISNGIKKDDFYQPQGVQVFFDPVSNNHYILPVHKSSNENGAYLLPSQPGFNPREIYLVQGQVPFNKNDIYFPPPQPISKIENNLTLKGNLILSKLNTAGFKFDYETPAFGWNDIIGIVFPKTTGTGTPTFAAFRGVIYQYQFTVGDQFTVNYHMPHDYVIGTDVHLHFHWALKVATAENITWGADLSYAKGHNQEAFPNVITFATAAVAANSVTNQQHMLSEMQISTVGGSGGTMINTTNLEPDGIIMAKIHLDANTGAEKPFLLQADVHYQTNCIATKNRAPDFYI